MGREAFGRYARERREALHYTRGHVATRLVIASGGDYFDTTSVRNIEEGKRELTDPNGNPLDLYEWLIEILSMDRDEAHAALRGLPEGISVEDIRELRRTASERRAARPTAATRAATPEGAAASATGSSSDLGKASELYLTISPAPAEPEAA
jgi:hypothetical protein